MQYPKSKILTFFYVYCSTCNRKIEVTPDKFNTVVHCEACGDRIFAEAS